MSRDDFLRELQQRIAHLPKEEQDAAMTYYMEYFEEAADDAAAWNDLGSPAEAAARIIEDYNQRSGGNYNNYGPPPNYQPVRKRRNGCLIAVIVAAVLILLLMILSFAGAGLAFSALTTNVSVGDEMMVEVMDWAGSTTVETTTLSKELLFDGFGAIKAELAGSDLHILPGEDYKLSIIEGAGKSFTYKVEKGTLILIENKPDKIHDTEGSEIVITVPADAYLDEIEIQQGVGNILINDLTMRELNLKAGVGNTELKNLSMKTLEVSGGMGNITGQGLQVTYQMDMENGVGNVELQGDFWGEIDLENGVGDMEIDFEKGRYDYGIHVENGLGAVEIDGESWTNSSHGSNGALYDIEVENGVGSLSLNFK